MQVVGAVEGAPFEMQATHGRTKAGFSQRFVTADNRVSRNGQHRRQSDPCCRERQKGKNHVTV